MENWYNVETYRAIDNEWVLISSNKYWDVALKIAKRERDDYIVMMDYLLYKKIIIGLE